MTSCTEETCQDELCAIIQSAKEQDQGRTNWISSLTHDPNVLSEGEPKTSAIGKPTFDATDIREVQVIHITARATIQWDIRHSSCCLGGTLVYQLTSFFRPKCYRSSNSIYSM